MSIRRLLLPLAVFPLLMPVFSIPLQATDFSRHASHIRFSSHLYNNHHTIWENLAKISFSAVGFLFSDRLLDVIPAMCFHASIQVYH